MTVYPIKRYKKIMSIIFLYLFIPLNPLMAFESRDFVVIDMLINSCYQDTQSCSKALLKIHNYQKNAAKNKKFSCQTRLLGLEANLIMVMNSNLKRNDAKSIIKDLKGYC